MFDRIEAGTYLIAAAATEGNLKIKNFSILPGSELKLLNGLKKDCSGIITATCNVTAELSRKVYEDFLSKKEQTVNEKKAVQLFCELGPHILKRDLKSMVYVIKKL